jgi:hypothetical protein
VLVLARQVLPTQCLVTHTLMVMPLQRRYGLGGDMVLVVASVVVGGDGDLMVTLGGKV